MNKVHLIIGLLALILGLILLIFGIYRVYKDETATGAKPTSANLAWGLIILSLVFLAAGIVVLISGRESKVAVVKTTKTQ